MFKEKDNKSIACVTGASGMIGSRIVQKLLCENYIVRVLSRNKTFSVPGVELFKGGLEDESVLTSFLEGAQLLFHCAAELKDEAIMWQVNVQGTERLLKLANTSDIRVFCYLSSVGVIGGTNLRCINEETPCNPQNTYEKTKWEAEKLFTNIVVGRKVIILRPTNVIDERKLGVLTLIIHKSFLNKLKILVKGGECSHIVHADDVASAAIHLISLNLDNPQCFIVSADHEAWNSYAELVSLCKVIKKDSQQNDIKPVLHFPVIVPHLARLLIRRKSIRGDARYSSKKLMSTGFKFPLGIKGAIQKVTQFGKKDTI